MKYMITIITLSLSIGVLANVNCSGVPERVYAGAHGGGGAGNKYWVVHPNWETYSLGSVTEELAKSRFSLAITALVAGKSIELSFYTHTDCDQAREEKVEPTAMSLLK